MLSQQISLNIQIKSIEEPRHITAKSGRNFTIQRFTGVPHGPFMERAHPSLFQMLPKHTTDIHRYAPGDHVRVFFEVDGNYFKVHKLERCNPPAPRPVKSTYEYVPDPHNNLPG